MLAVISDIHGNYPALQSVIDELDSIGCDKIISLGDVAGYYCMINECIRLLKSRNIINLMGNHDKYLVSNTRCPRSQSANNCLDFQDMVITEENRKWLANSPLTINMDDMNFMHGGWEDPVDEYLSTITHQYFENRDGKYFFSGHTHVQVLADFGSKIYCNPGSVGQPRDGDPRAAFALFDNGVITLKRVEYDIDLMAKKMKEANFSSYFYQNLHKGTRIGGSISFAEVRNKGEKS